MTYSDEQRRADREVYAAYEEMMKRRGLVKEVWISRDGRECFEWIKPNEGGLKSEDKERGTQSGILAT